MSAFPKKFALDPPPRYSKMPCQSYIAPKITPNISPIPKTGLSSICDVQNLIENAQCFQYLRELNNGTPKHKKEELKKLKFTNQFLFGCYMPPYYSVLNFKLMPKYVLHKQNPKAIISKSLALCNKIIEHENNIFEKWLSTIWEENLKYRRLNVVQHIDDYIQSVCVFLTSYINSHYSGMYLAINTILYIVDEDETSKIEMTYCDRIKTADINYITDIPKINIENMDSKISFTNHVYKPPPKVPFIEDKVCQTLSNEYSIDVNICLSSLKNIMHLEKLNSLWIIPVKIDLDVNNCKTINIGQALALGLFSQHDKKLYYLRKEIKNKFRKLNPTIKNVESDYSSLKYNYDKWILNKNDTNNGIIKSFHLIVRNKAQPKFIYNKHKMSEAVLIPKVEYQPEFGFEKFTEDELIEYWLNTYFRSPKTKFNIVSVQYNMDIMMIKQKNFENNNFLSDDIKQKLLHRLYLTIDKLSQYDKGEYLLLHNPRKKLQIEIYKPVEYGGVNLINLCTYLQQIDVSNVLCFNPIDPDIICPIHEYFKVAPCMFKPNQTEFNLIPIIEELNNFISAEETKQSVEKKQEAIRIRKKKERCRAKQQLQRKKEDNLQKVSQLILNGDTSLYNLEKLKNHY